MSDLESVIGWDKIFFLDNLHAKVFLGERQAVTGSANLTRNGLSGKVLTELCVSLGSLKSLLRLEKLLERWRKNAQRQYPTSKAKEERLLKLSALWSEAIVHRVIKIPAKSEVEFLEFKLLGNDHFYVSWYQSCDYYKYSPEIELIDHLIADDMNFAAGDIVQKNRWILAWRMTNKLAPHKRVAPYWIFIHEIFENGTVGETDYPTCTIQRTDWDLPPAPFELTKEVIGAFQRAIVLPELSKYFIQNEDVFTVQRSLKGLPLLLDAMRKELSS